MEVAIVGNVPGMHGQHVHAFGCVNLGGGAQRQALGAADLVYQAGFHQIQYARAGFVVHLGEIGARAEPPPLGKLPSAICPNVGVGNGHIVQEPGHLAPAPQRLLQLDLVWPRVADQHQQLTRQGALAFGLGVQENGKDRLLNLALLEAGRVGLNITRLG